MRLIPSREAVNFLAQAAPKPWAERLLRWMAFDEGLVAYCSRGKVQPYSNVGAFTAEHFQEAGEFPGTKMDAVIRKHYSPEFAAKLVGKDHAGRVDDEPFEWDESEDPRALDIGFFSICYRDRLEWRHAEGGLRAWKRRTQ